MEPEIILLCEVLAALTLYTIFGGADFGGGIWELNTAFQATDKERQMIHRAIGPVWEANHVWLLFVIVVMVNGFPPVYAGLSRALWLPLLLALLGIVCRGAAFAFRAYSVGEAELQQFWQAIFALGSTAAPFFFGACIGAVSSGDLGITSEGQFNGNYLTQWVCPLALFSAFFSVGICSYVSAFFLTREASIAGDAQMTALWRQRSMSTGIWVGMLAMVGLVLLRLESPHLTKGFSERAWFLIIISLASGIFSIWAMWKSHFFLAVVGASTTIASVIVGWGVAQYPHLVPPNIDIEAAKSPANVLWLMIYVTIAGAVLLLPSLIWLFVIFKTADSIQETQAPDKAKSY
jgi:cytochrome d ubiquinol oxidase subunit II